MVPQDQQILKPIQPNTIIASSSDKLGYILILTGSFFFTAIVGGLFGFDLHAYLNQDLRQLNPQSVLGIWMYWPEFCIGIALLILSLWGMRDTRLHSAVIRWAAFGLAISAFGYFIYLLGWYFPGLFVEMFALGISLVLILIGSVRNIF